MNVIFITLMQYCKLKKNKKHIASLCKVYIGQSSHNEDLIVQTIAEKENYWQIYHTDFTPKKNYSTVKRNCRIDKWFFA